MVNKHLISPNIILDPIDIGKWQSYQPYNNKEQLALQRQSFIYTGLHNQYGDIPFIFSTYIQDLHDKIMQMSQEIRVEDTETVIENEVYYTTKIEGAKTTRKRTQEIHNGSPVQNNDYSEKMIKNSFDAVKYLNLHPGEIKKEILLSTWNILTNDACDNLDITGNEMYPYRSGDVLVGGYEGLDFTKVERMMDQWIDFYNSKSLDNYPFIKAALLHLSFETIHPFCDGNGRLGRLLINNYLINQGFESTKAVSFSMEIDKRRTHYDVAFVDSENLYNDATPFIEYMLQVMYSSFDFALECQKTNEEQNFDR